MIIVHVAKEEQWKKSLKTGLYGEFSIKKDGFIHCSTIEDIVDVANDNLKEIDDNLVIVYIDTDLLKSELKWEQRGNKGITFPHIYGLLNIDCVIKQAPFKKNENGNFYLSQN